MKRITRLIFIILMLFVIADVLLSQAKPNIVLLSIDDWAWNGTPIRMDYEMANSQMP